MNRPIPWRGEPPPAGFHFEARVDDDWRLTVGAGRKCRGAKGCPREVVAELRRRAYLHQTKKHVDRWYGYCDEHLYANWIEDGQIMEWVLRKDES